MEQDFEIVQCAVKYYVEINKWDKQHHCSDGWEMKGPFTNYADAEEEINRIENDYCAEFKVVRKLEEI